MRQATRDQRAYGLRPLRKIDAKNPRYSLRRSALWLTANEKWILAKTAGNTWYVQPTEHANIAERQINVGGYTLSDALDKLHMALIDLRLGKKPDTSPPHINA